jgi:molybdate transport system substrate-binding protein
MTVLRILSAGAAMGLLLALKAEFEAGSGCSVAAAFGPVGTIAEQLTLGVPCDVLITSEKMYRQLLEQGVWRASGVAELGSVCTSVAVRVGDGVLDVSTPQLLSQSLLSCDAIFFPDPDRSTAGIHLVRTLDQLGIRDRLIDRLRPFPDGAAAMGALAYCRDSRPVGCTQATEIAYTEGVTEAGPLPEPHRLDTKYFAVAVSEPGAGVAAEFIEFLGGDHVRHLIKQAGFL